MSSLLEINLGINKNKNKVNQVDCLKNNNTLLKIRLSENDTPEVLEFSSFWVVDFLKMEEEKLILEVQARIFERFMWIIFLYGI